MAERQSDQAGNSGEAAAMLRTPAPPSVLTALTQAPIGVAIFDHNMRYLAASGRFLTDQGLPGDMPLVGRLHYDVFPEVPARWRDVHARALRDGVALSEEADPYVHRNGQIEWIRWSVTPWRTEDGAIGGLVLYTEVVTPAVEARLSLEATEARYRAVFDQVAMGVARVAPDGRFLEVNDRFCAIAGYPRDELLDLTFQQITHPEDLDTDVAQAAALLAGEIATYAMEKRYLTKSGEAVWINLTVSLVRTEAGEPDYFVAIAEDINFRKAAEAEQLSYQDHLRLLINELNHRVKNTLATVQSMAAQTMRGEADQKAAYETFVGRLVGLSQVHDVLTRERWQGAALRDVVERALRPFIGALLAGGGAERVRLDGPEVWLQPGAALSMALVFHELATNAVKYGALSTAAGRVDLTWALDGERLTLDWMESGGPPVTAPTRRGFGSRLIQRGLKGELKGQAVLRFEPGGLVCAMEAKVPEKAMAPSLFVDL